MQAVRNKHAWRGFAAGGWQDEINVHDFIVANVTPYAGGPDFLAEPSARTLAVWDKLQPYFQEEIKKGVLDVDASTPATPTAFRPGSIDRDNEVIVGLQTEPAPAAIRRFSPTRTSSRRPTGRTWATP